MIDTINYIINGAPVIEAKAIDSYPGTETKSSKALAICHSKFLPALMIVRNTHPKMLSEIDFCADDGVKKNFISDVILIFRLLG